jgi:hypothetical protein
MLEKRKGKEGRETKWKEKGNGNGNKKEGRAL